MSGRYGGYEEQPFIAELYDAEYSDIGKFNRSTKRNLDVDFFVGYSKAAAGRTLELGCGTGRVLIPTAAAGCEITGLDLSDFMLRKCLDKLSSEPLETQRRVRLVQGNMTDFSTGESYALITLPFRPFQHLVIVDEQKGCLNCVRRHLAPGGKLVFDVFNPKLPGLYDASYLVEKEDIPEMQLPDGRRLRRASRRAAFHRDQQYNDVELIYYLTYPDGRTERLVQAFPMRYFFRYEMEHLLELCGFRIVDMFGDFDKSAFESDSPEMIFVAEKKA